MNKDDLNIQSTEEMIRDSIRDSLIMQAITDHISYWYESKGISNEYLAELADFCDYSKPVVDYLVSNDALILPKEYLNSNYAMTDRNKKIELMTKYLKHIIKGE